MSKQIDRIRKIRTFLLNLVDGLTPEQLNQIPSGFNNNIIWNLGHMVAAQQGVCYKRAGLPTVTTEDFFMAYKPESKPSGFVDAKGIDEIKTLFFTTLTKLEDDYSDNLFANYPTWTTRYGVEIASIDDALEFLMFHEGLHSGVVTAMKKLATT